MRPLLFVLLVLSACSAVNRDHCGNQSGDATCTERDASRPFCSLCVADNDGCLAKAPTADCAATGAEPGSTGASSSTTTPTTSGSTDTGSPSTTEIDGTSTSTSSTSTSTTSTSTTSTSTGPGETGSTGEASTGTTASDPMCGNDVKEGEEVCDGTDLAEKTCATLLPDKWGGGKLGCNDCASFNDSACCIGLGQKCDPFMPEEVCCPGLACKNDALPSVESHCKNP